MSILDVSHSQFYYSSNNYEREKMKKLIQLYMTNFMYISRECQIWFILCFLLIMLVSSLFILCNNSLLRWHRNQHTVV